MGHSNFDSRFVSESDTVQPNLVPNRAIPLKCDIRSISERNSDSCLAEKSLKTLVPRMEHALSQAPRLLLTAYEPFGTWKTNASQLCLQRLLPLLDPTWQITTRIYPVDFEAARPLLEADLFGQFDFTLHLGQTQQTARIRLEAVGLNVGAVPGKAESETFSLISDGPAAYHCPLPLTDWAAQLRASGIPAYVSYHAGTYLCNAALYWCHHLIARHNLATESCFVHVPLDLSQVANLPGDFLALPSELVADAVARIIRMWTDRRKNTVSFA
jgi:pyroglutamyl-peptidase